MQPFQIVHFVEPARRLKFLCAVFSPLRAAQSLTVIRELEDVEVSPPGDACFECELSAPVSMSPVWSLNGEALQPSPEVLLEKTGAVHRMTLRRTSADTAGEVEFTCGKAKSKAQLRVQSQ